MDPLPEEAIHHERHVRVICIGAGASGLCLAYKLQRSFRNYSLTVYDKNPSVGGTWLENRYPGCACDVPSHNYVYSFEPKADFSSVYASSTEIQGYFEDFAEKYQLGQHLKLSHAVEKTTWVEEEGRWEVVARDLTTGETVRDWCHMLVHATGYLNSPAWPALPGLDEYEGVRVHSADYDAGLSLAGRDVLLIGAGSSAVQILPAIQPVVRSVTIFVRSPTWLLPDISTEAGRFTPEEVARFVREPEAVLALRQENERTMNSIFTMYLRDSILQKQCRALLESEMRKIVGDEEAADKLIPKFAVGCKRVIPSGFKYLRALKEDNVRVVYAGVQAFTRTGVISDLGTSHDGDVAICATGFDTSYVSRYPIYGPSGRNLQTEWAESITGYMGVGIPEFPNTFTMLGPYSPVSNGPTLIAIEAQADYICALVDRYQTDPSVRSLRPRAAAGAAFTAHVARFMGARAAWADGCRSSHNNHRAGGRVPTTWPGSTLHYLEAVREVRWDDWAVGRAGGDGPGWFAWLGASGVSRAEWDPTADLAYYLRPGGGGDGGAGAGTGAAWGSRWRRDAVVHRSGTMPPRVLHRQAKLAAAEGGEEGSGGV